MKLCRPRHPEIWALTTQACIWTGFAVLILSYEFKAINLKVQCDCIAGINVTCGNTTYPIHEYRIIGNCWYMDGIKGPEVSTYEPSVVGPVTLIVFCLILVSILIVPSCCHDECRGYSIECCPRGTIVQPDIEQPLLSEEIELSSLSDSETEHEFLAV
jgi:hypothetical protein